MEQQWKVDGWHLVAVSQVVADRVAVAMLGIPGNRYVLVNADGSCANRNDTGRACSFAFSQWAAAKRHAGWQAGVYVATVQAGAVVVLEVRQAPRNPR